MIKYANVFTFPFARTYQVCGRAWTNGREQPEWWTFVICRAKRTMIQHWGPALYAERKAQWNGTLHCKGVQA